MTAPAPSSGHLGQAGYFRLLRLIAQLKMLEILTKDDARLRGGGRASDPEGSSGSGSDVYTSTGDRLMTRGVRSNWSPAWLLAGLPGLLSVRHFATHENEMAAIAGYTTAMVDLRAKTRLRSSVSPPPPTAEGQGEAEDTRTAQEGRGRGRGRRRREDASGAGRGGAAPPATS